MPHCARFCCSCSHWLPHRAGTYSGSRVTLTADRKDFSFLSPHIQLLFLRLTWDVVCQGFLLALPGCWLPNVLSLLNNHAYAPWWKVLSFPGIIAVGLLCHANVHWTPDFPLLGPVLHFIDTATSSWALITTMLKPIRTIAITQCLPTLGNIFNVSCGLPHFFLTTALPDRHFFFFFF